MAQKFHHVYNILNVKVNIKVFSGFNIFMPASVKELVLTAQKLQNGTEMKYTDFHLIDNAF